VTAGVVHCAAKDGYRNPSQNLRTQLEKMIRPAGLEPWPKLWQNLWASRETELMEQFPAHVVVAWPGHTQHVAQKHYQETKKPRKTLVSSGFSSSSQWALLDSNQ